LKTYTYDPAGKGNITSNTAAGGKQTQFEYDLKRRLTKTIYPYGHSVVQQHDNNGNVTELVALKTLVIP